MKKFKSSYYSVSDGVTALKIHHDTVHQKVDKQHIWQKSSVFNRVWVISDLLNGQC